MIGLRDNFHLIVSIMMQFVGERGDAPLVSDKDSQ
jgi:hypothetical protein